jgi:hypothetical protein
MIHPDDAPDLDQSPSPATHAKKKAGHRSGASHPRDKGEIRFGVVLVIHGSLRHQGRGATRQAGCSTCLASPQMAGAV